VSSEAVVPPEAAGVRLDRFLAEQEGVGSRAAAERLIGAGVVRVDGSPRSKSYRLEAGEAVAWQPVALVPVAEEEAPEAEFRIVWQDDDIVVVDKPSGVIVHPGAGRAGGTLADALLPHGAVGGPEGRAGIVHRLDRDTSGLLVVARSEDAYRGLSRLVRRRALEREYLALVRGHPRSWRGRIEAPIGRDRRDPTRQSLDTDTPRAAVTHFEVEELLPEHALLRVRLETGRTHQIRVHLAAIDLPVVGDRVYGVPGLGLARQFLHACRLAFPHPVTGEGIDVVSPPPPELARALAAARG
jgi:23S rRNA pseudouridine1911/1915/1917 synthase